MNFIDKIYITEEIDYYDGVISGICRIPNNNQEYVFVLLHQKENTRVFGIYTLPLYRVHDDVLDFEDKYLHCLYIE